MDRFIASHGNFSIWQLAENGLFDLARFVVFENYKHHQQLSDATLLSSDEIQEVYDEEVRFFSQSKIFVAKDNQGEIVGAIRIMKWNKKEELPITKLFGIESINGMSFKDSTANIWHVGRFAVSSNIGRNCISLFRVLMMYAVAPICKQENGIMIAECDSKLFKTVKNLGMKVIALNEGIEYLGSVTIPLYATSSGLVEFVVRNCALALNVEGTMNTGERPTLSYPEKISA